MNDCLGNEVHAGDIVFAKDRVYKVLKVCEKQVRCQCFARSTAEGWIKDNQTQRTRIKDNTWIRGYRWIETPKEKLVYPFEMVKLDGQSVMQQLLSLNLVC